MKLTMRLLETFREYGIAVGYLIVNNVVNQQDAAQCSFLNEKRKMQLTYLSHLRTYLKSHPKIVETPLLPTEVHGIQRVREFARYLFPVETN